MMATDPTSPYLHEIIIQKLKIKKQLEGTEFTNVVVSCDWDLHTWHQNHPEVRHGVSNTVEFILPSGEGEDFVPFDQLDKETVVGWIEQNVPNFEDIKAHQEQLPSLQFDDGEYEYITTPFLSKPEVEADVPPVVEDDAPEV